MDPVSIDTHQLEEFAAVLRQYPGMMAKAERVVVNNMAFGVRQEAIDWGIPRAMIVRNRNILRISLKVDKCGTTGDKATLGMASRDRFGGLLEQELGGQLQRQPATLAARGGKAQGTIRQAFRLRGQIIGPEDIDIANDTGSATQRIAAFISNLEKRGYTQAFRIHGHPSIPAGVYRLGKKTSRPGYPQARKLVTLRVFHGNKVSVKREPWMKPSIARWLAAHSRQSEFAKALRFLVDRQAARLKRS
jgi:hypothetical protein